MPKIRQVIRYCRANNLTELTPEDCRKAGLSEDETWLALEELNRINYLGTFGRDRIDDTHFFHSYRIVR